MPLFQPTETRNISGWKNSNYTVLPCQRKGEHCTASMSLSSMISVVFITAKCCYAHLITIRWRVSLTHKINSIQFTCYNALRCFVSVYTLHNMFAIRRIYVTRHNVSYCEPGFKLVQLEYPYDDINWLCSLTTVGIGCYFSCLVVTGAGNRVSKLMQICIIIGVVQRNTFLHYRV